MSSLESLLYVSTARADLGDAEFDALLGSAQRNNARLGLTGALLKYGPRFVQLLEGPGDALDTCFARIAADPRHGDVRIVHRAPVAERRFGRWSMRNIHIAFGADKVVDAFLAALAAPTPDPADVARAIELLAALARRGAPG